jgi:transposase
VNDPCQTCVEMIRGLNPTASGEIRWDCPRCGCRVVARRRDRLLVPLALAAGLVGCLVARALLHAAGVPL